MTLKCAYCMTYDSLGRRCSLETWEGAGRAVQRCTMRKPAILQSCETRRSHFEAHFREHIWSRDEQIRCWPSEAFGVIYLGCVESDRWGQCSERHHGGFKASFSASSVFVLADNFWSSPVHSSHPLAPADKLCCSSLLGGGGEGKKGARYVIAAV